MAAILLPSRWGTQPPPLTPVDKNHPATNGLVALFDRGFDVVNWQGPSANTGTRRGGPWGQGTDYSGTANTQFAHRAEYAQTGAFTVLALFDLDALTNYGGVIVKQASTTTNMPYEFRLGSGPTDSDLHLVRANGSSYRSWGSGSARLSAPATRQLVGVSMSSGLLESTDFPRFYANGTGYTGSTITSAGTGLVTDTSATVWIAARSDSATYIDGNVYWIGLWNRQLSDAEVKAIYNQPFDFYLPIQRRIYFDTVAGGSSTLTATATLDAAIQAAQTATATLDAAIQAAQTTTTTLDGVIAVQNTATVTLDAAIQQALTATTTLDAAIQATMSATSTLDAVIQNPGVNTYTLTATLDAAIREAKTLTATLDAAIQITNTSTVTLDAVIVSVNTATATLDATIQSAATAYALLDAYIFDADAPVVVPDTTQTPAGKSKKTRDSRRRYVMPDDTIIMATPDEAEQLVKLFVKPKPQKKVPKRVVKTLRKVDLVDFEPVSSDTVETAKIVVKPRKAVWESDSTVYEKAIQLFVEREQKRRRYEEELILLYA